MESLLLDLSCLFIFFYLFIFFTVNLAHLGLIIFTLYFVLISYSTIKKPDMHAKIAAIFCLQNMVNYPFIPSQLVFVLRAKLLKIIMKCTNIMLL